MKRRRTTFLCIGVGLALLLSACGQKEPDPVDDFVWDRVASYSTTTNSSEGKTTAMLEAPDYAAIVAELVKNEPDIEITSDVLEKAIGDYPDMVKEYTFEVSVEDEEVIRQGFLDQISYEIMARGIAAMEFSYTEQWEVE